MTARTLKLSLAQFSALPDSAFVNPRFSAQLRRPWMKLNFFTIQDKTIFTLQYSEYCGKIHPFEEFTLYSTQDLA